MRKLYKFYWYCGRMGRVEGLFLATEEELRKAYGKRVYLGEILGKHSEIYGELGEDDVTLVTEDQNVISVLEANGGLIGYNPLEYLDGESH